ncbi:MAG: hypothetical protein IT448_10885 [Phycisphaerales bacterium]|nr:hypothetical protein [Phycisphaerales bacterium]
MHKYETLAVLAACLMLLCSTAANAVISIRVTPEQPVGVFTPEHPPLVSIEVSTDRPLLPKGSWDGTIRVRQLDLLTNKELTTFLTCPSPDGGPRILTYAPKLEYGVYRLDVSIVKDIDEQFPQGRTAIPGTQTVRTSIAYGPAAMPKDLPDDWPLAHHLTTVSPTGEIPLPGFKVYRVFLHWYEANPARGVYDWSKLDSTAAKVREAGGKLHITDNTAPAWTVSPEKAQQWRFRTVKEATTIPPDDMNDWRMYVRALLDRYNSDGSELISSMGVWSEGNTKTNYNGTYEQLVEMTRIAHEEAQRTPGKPKVVGIGVSPGNHQVYINGLIDAGVCKYSDAISSHWYGGLHTYSKNPKLHSIYTQWKMMHDPMVKAGFDLPIWNTESGIKTVEREDGRLIPQDELNRRAEASPDFNPKEPWKVGKVWRSVGEQRAAAEFVAGVVRLMSLGVEKTFTYQHYGFYREGSVSLKWVTLAVLGDAFRKVDYHVVEPVEAQVVDAPADIKTMAFRVGKKDGRRFILVWAYQENDNVDIWKAWQPWLAPVKIRVAVTSPTATISDLYARHSESAEVKDGWTTVMAGEEPVYIWENR